MPPCPVRWGSILLEESLIGSPSSGQEKEASDWILWISDKITQEHLPQMLQHLPSQSELRCWAGLPAVVTPWAQVASESLPIRERRRRALWDSLEMSQNWNHSMGETYPSSAWGEACPHQLCWTSLPTCGAPAKSCQLLPFGGGAGLPVSTLSGSFSSF